MDHIDEEDNWSKTEDDQIIDKSSHIEEVVDELAKEFDLKTTAIKRRSIQEISEIDNAFANVFANFIWGSWIYSP